MNPPLTSPIYGVLAQFLTPEAAIKAGSAMHERGYRYMEAYSPFPVDGLAESIGYRRNHMPLIVLLGGIIGGLSGYFLQYYTAVYDYPYEVAGKPLHSWPMFIPITFELTILGAAFAAVFGMLFLNGLPMPYHPVFNVPEFGLASRDRFFLFVRHDDPLFEPERTARELEAFGPKSVALVPREPPPEAQDA